MSEERETSATPERKDKWNEALDAAVAEASVPNKSHSGTALSTLRVLIPVLVILLIALAALQVNRSRLSSMTEERVRQGVETKLLLAAGAIEDYVRRTGVLPESLGDVRIDRMSVEYTRKGSDAYELRADAVRSTLVYRSDHRFVEELQSSSDGGS